MWSTPEGDRVVCGYEAVLIRDAIAGMIDELEILADQTSFPPLEYGIPVWDNLTWQQKLATLDQVVRYLLQSTRSTLPLTAISESAIGAIFAQIKCNVEVELDMSDSEDESEFHELESWRSLILKVFGEPRYTDDGSLVGTSIGDDDYSNEHYPTGPDDDRTDCWFHVIDRLADRLLWDRDYELEAIFADRDPDSTSKLKGLTGIDNSYFQEIALDLKADQVATVIQRVKAITHRQ
ncbi:MAG: hypothetical protein SGI77_03325 [Pirellulaceae bacterium]|nr:hypothetical protein [Pirellulaceae bacterium]